jgi:hypothetical protein
MTMAKINVQGTPITVYSEDDKDFISLTDMLKAKRLNQIAIRQRKLMSADAGTRRLQGTGA